MRRLPGPRGRAGVSSSPPARPCHRARSSGTGRGLHPALLASAVPSWNTRTCHHDPQQPRQLHSPEVGARLLQLGGGPGQPLGPRDAAAQLPLGPGAWRPQPRHGARPQQPRARPGGSEAAHWSCNVASVYTLNLKTLAEHREVTAEHCRSLPCILDGGCCSLDSEL